MKQLFRGAGIIVVPEDSIETNDKGDIFVRTKHAKALSNLIFLLKDVYKDKIDYLNKYDFYKFIAETYNNLICENGDVLENISELLDYIEGRFGCFAY
jgi:hypothetical protein